ncbi:MAG TPA: 30S ribosomal protein S17 [Candidatus Paceibacterota bacterium]|jgi:small subunit ribosomal protein S17|nr:30S ribosomal protein S17 [Candidatus Paceibacterota bacterium]
MEAITKQGKTFEGVVVKSAMKDTCTVMVERYVKHPKYKKYVRHSKKFLVHDAGNTAPVGARVVIKEVKPMSKLKRFALAEVLKAPVSEE